MNGVKMDLRPPVHRSWLRLDGIILRPGETFSYWRLIGKPSRRKGYKEGMVLFLGRIGGDIGGGWKERTRRGRSPWSPTTPS